MRKMRLCLCTALMFVFAACVFDDSAAVPVDDETVEVGSLEEAIDLGVDVEDYLASEALVQAAPPDVKPLLSTVTCGGLVYTKQFASGCTPNGAICRTSNTPTECGGAASPCAYYTGTCGSISHRFTDRLFNADDLYFKTGTPGNPSATQAYMALDTGSSINGFILYRATAPQGGSLPSEPSAWSGELESLYCSGPGITYLRAKTSALTQGNGRWWAVLPAGMPASDQRMVHVFGGSCGSSGLSYRDMKTSDYLDLSHGWYDDQPAWVLDLGPTSGSPAHAYVRTANLQPAN